MNKVILVGFLTRDLDVKYAANGAMIVTSAIAVNRRFKKQDGSDGEEVMFIDVTIFGKYAEWATKYLAKGLKVLLEGRLKLDTWTDQSGQKRSKHSIIAESFNLLGQKLDSKPQAGEAESDEDVPF
jgi:single-strand DNA-binding protein